MSKKFSRQFKQKIILISIAIIVFISILVANSYFLLNKSFLEGKLNIKNIFKIEKIKAKENLSFAVVGDIDGYFMEFNKQGIPSLKNSSPDFILYNGLSIKDFYADDYLQLQKGGELVGIPYLFTTGNIDFSNSLFTYYRLFGPYYFDFNIGDSYFVLLDSTGKTDWEWQLKWLEEQLNHNKQYKNKFIVFGHSLLLKNTYDIHSIEEDNDDIIKTKIPNSVVKKFFSIFEQNNITTVFSFSGSNYSKVNRNSIDYVDLGCEDNSVLPNADCFKYILVNVTSNDIQYTLVSSGGESKSFIAVVKLFVSNIVSLFYSNITLFLLIVFVLIVLLVSLYIATDRHDNFYRDFTGHSIQNRKIKNIKVAMFSNNYLPFIGGVPISINRLYKGLKSNNSKHQVKIFTTQYNLNSGWDGEDVYRASTFSFIKSEYQLYNMFSKKINKAFKQNKYNIVHTHHPFLLGYRGLILGKRAKTPVVFTYHTKYQDYVHNLPIPGKHLKKLILHRNVKHYANRCDGIIAPTTTVEDYLRRLGVKKPVKVIPTGVDLSQYQNQEGIQQLRDKYIKEDEILLLSVSRLSLEKNLKFLVNGIDKISNKSEKSFKCLIVGGGPEKDNLQKYIEHKNLTDKIILVGDVKQEDIAKYYMAADIFVYASTSETQGLVLLEAMAGGCPVVAVNSSGVYDTIEYGYNGYKVIENTNKWAGKVANIMNDDRLMKTLSENSKNYSKMYSLEAIAESVSDFYRYVINSYNK